MYAKAIIPMVPGAKLLIVPNTFTIQSTEHEHVIDVQNGKTDMVNIKEGLVGHDSPEVFGNRKPNDRIILQANDGIRQGMK